MLDVTKNEQLARMLDEVTRNFGKSIRQLDRAAQASEDSRRLRSLLETQRSESSTARVRRPASEVRARAYLPRSSPPKRFAFYQGEF